MKIASIGQGGPEIEQYSSGWAAKRGLIFQMERAVPGGRYDMVLAGPTEGETVPFCQTEVLIAYGKEAGALAQRIQAWQATPGRSGRCACRAACPGIWPVPLLEHC